MMVGDGAIAVQSKHQYSTPAMYGSDGIPMPITKQRTLEYLEMEWGSYVERFNRLPKDEQEQRLSRTGYASLHDMLAHVLAWWEGGMRIILAIAQGSEYERRKYDFDSFNAEAVTRYREWEETKFMAHFETSRRKMAADLKSMDETVFENHHVKAWLDAAVIHHAREHMLVLSRFLSIDMLENEWAEYPENFERLNAERQKEFLARQGFETFHDLLAHIVGWWEEGARIITGIMDSPSFTWTDQNTDQFNRELTEKYASWSDSDLFKHYHTVRLALIDMVDDLPEDAFLNKDIGGWLTDDVVEHYDEHLLRV